MSAQIYTLFPEGSKLHRAQNAMERIAELEGHLAVAKDAAERAWMVRARVEGSILTADFERERFAAWWDGKP